MKIKTNRRPTLKSFRPWKSWRGVSALILGGLWAANANGQQLTWAPNGTSPSDGSGTWLAGNNWWNGSSIVSGTWSGATPNGAVFGNGTVGTYAVDLGGNTIQTTNLVFNTSGYTVQNGTLGFIAPAGAATFNFITLGANVATTLSAGVTNTYGGNSLMTVGSGSTLTLTGGAAYSGNTLTSGSGTVDFSSGTYAGNNFVLWTQANTSIEAATMNIGRLLVGYAGNSTLTVNSVSAQITGNGSGGNNLIGRGGNTGIFDLKQGNVNFTHSGNDLRIGYDSGSKGTLTVEGGTMNLGTANNVYVNFGGIGSGGAGTFNQSGGTVIANSVAFGGGAGAGGSYAAGSSATMKMTGGSLYVGSGGINVNTGNSGTLNTSITLSGGTIGALANWTSTANATLATTGGNLTLQAASTNGTANNIIWNGALSGAGGLHITGPGTVTLGGVNTYTGNTTVDGIALLANTGHLSFEIGINGVNNQINGTGNLTLNGALDFNLTGADGTAGNSWTIVNAANGLSVTYDSGFTVDGFTESISNPALWTSGNYIYNEANGILSVGAVPEPATNALILGGIGALFAFRRNFRKK